MLAILNYSHSLEVCDQGPIRAHEIQHQLLQERVDICNAKHGWNFMVADISERHCVIYDMAMSDEIASQAFHFLSRSIQDIGVLSKSHEHEMYSDVRSVSSVSSCGTVLFSQRFCPSASTE